jgi:hypothetical protein
VVKLGGSRHGASFLYLVIPACAESGKFQAASQRPCADPSFTIRLNFQPLRQSARAIG